MIQGPRVVHRRFSRCVGTQCHVLSHYCARRASFQHRVLVVVTLQSRMLGVYEATNRRPSMVVVRVGVDGALPSYRPPSPDSAGPAWRRMFPRLPPPPSRPPTISSADTYFPAKMGLHVHQAFTPSLQAQCWFPRRNGTHCLAGRVDPTNVCRSG